ncbi:MAG: glycoside hydrolase family 3 C-terminal domain-containing protein [Prevotellaceae bacterium]|jgi:beta-glucosidase|nr:glycoside hydrolase family 3 C-terminal domain-containing protein [Prevotellaceae bacterium]
MNTKIIIVIVALLLNSNVLLNAQQKSWIDFNQNGTKDLYENPDADIDVRISDLLSQMTVEEKLSLLMETAPPIPRLGIGKYYHGNEALHGIVRPGHFTVFPQAIALAATWNPALIKDVASAVSSESRARWNELEQGKKQTFQFSDLLTFWSPTVNMARDPRWGRTPETYGEDPYLSAQIGVAFVHGLQGDDPKYLKAVSTPKHFMANNEEHNRFHCKVETSEQVLRNYFLPAFQALITKGKAHSIMTAYPAINGIPCTANKWLLTDILRKEWGFEGYVVSDCGAVGHIHGAHHFTDSYEEAAVAALKAGLDLECGNTFNNLHSALQKGLVNEQDITGAAYHVLRSRFKLGLFDDPSLVKYNQIPPSTVGCKEHQQLALETARQSIVLLKNNGILPLNANKIKSIAVFGINAATSEFGDYSGTPLNEPVSPLRGIINRAGDRIKVHNLPWIGNLSQHEIIRPEYFFHKTGDGSLKKGLKAEYFSDHDFKNLFSTVIEGQVNFEPANQPPNPSVPPAPLSVRWSGVLKPNVSGEYEIGIVKSGLMRLFLNGEKLFDHDSKERGVYMKTTSLVAGQTYDIVAEYSYWVRTDWTGERPTAINCALLWKAPNRQSAGLYAAEKAMAKKSDVAIVVLGINRSIEMEGHDRNSIRLPEDQEQFIREIYKANPKTVLILVAGSQMSIRWEQDNIPAIINAWYPGEQGGNAIAEVLFGDYNPAGRLPLTYYESLDDIPPFNDYKITNGRTYMYFDKTPIYPFGFGLSYSTFEYSNIHVDKQDFAIGETIKITVDVKNTGRYDGDEVVQLYLREPKTGEARPLRQLKGLQRIHLKKNESKSVSFELDREALSYWNSDNNFVVETGTYEIQIGASSADIRQTTEVKIVL